MRDPRYDVLFEPVTIGPVVAKNRFFQVPHCNGMGYRDPSGEAYMRQVKAEGGWAVVCTEEVEIHPSADTGPTIQLRIWSDQGRIAARLSRRREPLHPPFWTGSRPGTKWKCSGPCPIAISEDTRCGVSGRSGARLDGQPSR